METDMQSQMTADQRIALQRKTIDEHMRAENAHEWPAVYDTFIQDERAYYDVVPLSSKFDGFKQKGFCGCAAGVEAHKDAGLKAAGSFSAQ